MALAAEDLSVPALRSAGVEASPALFLAALESCSRWQVPRRPPHTRRPGRAPGTCTPPHSAGGAAAARGHARVRARAEHARVQRRHARVRQGRQLGRRPRHLRQAARARRGALPSPHPVAALYRRARCLSLAHPRPAPAAQVSYGTAINACARGRRWQTALALLGRMRDGGEGPQPNAFVLSAAINACGGAGQWQEALRLLAILRDKAR